jgi:radical SAM protein with 4Fe4S-binding SPASM domain
MPQLSSISLEVTSRCNQECLYCYNRDRGAARPASDVPTESFLELVDLVAHQPVKQITLTGGEPLIRPGILPIIDRIASQGLRIGIVTNAIAATGKLAAELASRKISYAQVTFLGPDAATHDRIAGQGSFTARFAGVRNLIAAGVSVGGAFICTRLNYRVAGLTLETMFSWGIREHMCFMRFCPAGYGARSAATLAPFRDEVVEAIEQANRFGEMHRVLVHNKIPIPPCIARESDFPNVVFSFCGAGVADGECFVDQRGGVRLCGPHALELGSIRETPLDDLLGCRTVLEWKETCAPECAPCHLRPGCRGGCPVAEGDPLRESYWPMRIAQYERDLDRSAGGFSADVPICGFPLNTRIGVKQSDSESNLIECRKDN